MFVYYLSFILFFSLIPRKKPAKEGIIFRTRIFYYLTCILLLMKTGSILGQDPERYSEFRNKFFALAIDYKLDEALALFNGTDEADYEVLADKNISLIQKGFDLVKPYQSQEGDYNIQAAFAISYGIQANHAGLKEQAKFGDLSVKHCKKALKLDPRLPHPNFILGRFHYELADMSKATAKIAEAFIDKEEIDRASYDLALSYLKVACEVAPSRFLYNYYTGASYKKLGNEELALHFFRLADKNFRYTEDDHKADKDLQKQLKKM
jgi:tetratricopeptide (TPR) repeat protein